MYFVEICHIYSDTQTKRRRGCKERGKEQRRMRRAYLEVVVEGLVDLGHDVGTVGQRGLDLLETLGQQRQLLPVDERETKGKEMEGGVSQ